MRYSIRLLEPRGPRFPAVGNLNRGLTLLLDAIEVTDEKGAMKPLSDLIPSDLSSEPSANEVEK